MKPKIMLVDDIEIANFLLKRQLLKINIDADIFDFTDPELAYKSVNEINPDIIFLDLNMPKINGWDFLDKMQADKLFYKVIILTSSISILDKQRSKNYNNVVAFYEKPITREMLASCIQSALQTNFLLS